MLVAIAAGLATVTGVVEAQASQWDGGVIVTRSTVRVERVDAGAAPGRLVVVHVGGALDGLGQRLSGEVELAPGEAVTLDVEPAGAAWRVAGGERGKRTLALPRGFVRTSTLSAAACAGHAAHPLYWRAVTVPLTVDATLTPDAPAADVRAALDASVATWNAITGAYLKLVVAGTTTTPSIGYVRGGANTNLITWVEQGWAQSALAIAATLTTFECDTGRLVDADVLWNGEAFVFSAGPVGVAGAQDVANTATHELGHLVGFDHTPDPESTMYADAAPGEIKKRDLTSDDIAGMLAVYPVGDEPVDDAGCCSTGGDRGGRAAALAVAVAAVIGRRRRR